MTKLLLILSRSNAQNGQHFAFSDLILIKHLGFIISL